MGSRLKENPDRTFYWFFEASCPIANDKDPDVLFQFPEDFSDEESRQTLPRFCFPYDIERVRDVVAVQHFTFVLTDLEGCQRFGFCRLTSSSHTCLCMLRPMRCENCWAPSTHIPCHWLSALSLCSWERSYWSGQRCPALLDMPPSPQGRGRKGSRTSSLQTPEDSLPSLRVGT
uniref:DENN domain containing 1C n=1 Tax=Oncorhynchus tshawytscha TaxID=74940 RepID=A0AAZ3SPJ5_ONCTS